MFQSHEAERPVEMVIRQVIYEDVKPQGKESGLVWGIAAHRALSLHAGQFRSKLGRTSRGTAVLEARLSLGKKRVQCGS